MNKALTRVGGRWSNVLGVASDSAAYMVLALRLLKKDHPHIVHIRCLAHLMHNAVQAAIGSSVVVSDAVELAINLSRIARPAAMQSKWAAEVKLRQLVEPRRVPKYYEIRWESLLTVLQFALDYLPGSVSFVRNGMEVVTELHRKLAACCAGSSESGVISLLRTKLLVAISELKRLQQFMDTMQLQRTTFGTLTKGIAFLEDNLKASARADARSIAAGFPVELRGLLDPFASLAIENTKAFRATVERSFQASMQKHFYKDVRVAQLADCAQLLDTRLPTRQRVPWSMLESAAKWWAQTTENPEEWLERIEAEHTLFNNMELPEVSDALMFWEERKQGTLRHMAMFACDLLSIPIGSAAVERSFSEEHRTDTKQASSTGTDYAEMKAVLYQNRDLDVQPAYKAPRALVFDTWFDRNFPRSADQPQPSADSVLLPDMVEVERAACDEQSPAHGCADNDEESNTPFVAALSLNLVSESDELVECEEEPAVPVAAQSMPGPS
jgi:hypothetical protein